MRRFLLAALLFSASAHGAGLEDQFGREVAVPGDARLTFFAADMDAAGLVGEAFGEAETDLMAQAGVLYVADISGMPRIVAKMFAKPKMRKYPYRIALDETGEVTADWPHREGAVTILGDTEPRFCMDADCLRAALAP